MQSVILLKAEVGTLKSIATSAKLISITSPTSFLITISCPLETAIFSISLPILP